MGEGKGGGGGGVVGGFHIKIKGTRLVWLKITLPQAVPILNFKQHTTYSVIFFSLIP